MKILKKNFENFFLLRIDLNKLKCIFGQNIGFDFFFKKWSKMVKNDQKWSKMVKNEHF